MTDDLATLNEDWTKVGTWDLPTTVTGLLWALGVVNRSAEEQAAALAHFVTLPAWIPAPDTLKTQVHGLLAHQIPNPPAPHTQTPLERLRAAHRYSEDQPRGPDGKFGSGDTISPLKGGGGTGKSGKELASIDAETDMGGLSQKTQDDATAKLMEIGGVTQAEAMQNTIDIFNKADAATVAAGVAWYGQAHDFTAGNGPVVESTLNGQPSTVNDDIKASGLDQPTMAGITAALSPQQSWGSNMAGAAAIANMYATDPSTPLTQEQADLLNTGYHSSSIGQWQNPDGTKFVAPSAMTGGNKSPADFGGVFVGHPTADGTPFSFKAGMTMGDILAGKGAPVDAPVGAMAAVAAVGLFKGVSAGGSGYGNIEKAMQIAGGGSVDKVLGGAKVRSFVNNINVPTNTSSVTIDSHMMEAMVNGVPKNEEERARGAKNMYNLTNPSKHMTAITGVPGVAGVKIGAYPVLADAVRQATIKINDALPGGGPGAAVTGYTPAQVQAVVWLQQIKDYPNGANQ